jgi:asparagine synthase (glutamine-hydrolysing)
MANSLEVRVPLLDHQFVEMVARIPSHLKLNGREGKYIFKKALMNIVPTDIVHRSKKGFDIPIGAWLRHELKGLGEDLLLQENTPTSHLFDTAYIQRLWEAHQSGLRDLSQPLWVLMSFQLWARQFL